MKFRKRLRARLSTLKMSLGRNLGFVKKKKDNHWKALSKELTQSDLHFKGIVLEDLIIEIRGGSVEAQIPIKRLEVIFT